MSNKAISRKRKDFVKVLELAAKIAELRSKLHKIEEKHYHKLAPGGMVYGKCNLQGGEMTPYENEPYLFKFNS